MEDDDDWTFTQQTEQPAGRKRRAGGRPAINRILEETGVHRDSRWDSPRKRALFTSDGPDSTTSGSDIPEGHADRPPEIEYSESLTSAKRQDEGGTKRLCSPNVELEMAVIQLQRDVDECHTELELPRKQTPAVILWPQRRSGFTSTPVPRYSGESHWEQYREVFEAIVCSNGWDDVTAALQLLSHLDGDALNVVALMFRNTHLPQDEFSAERNGDYIWRNIWTGLSVCNRSVTGSLPFGSSHILGRCCLWLAGLPFRLIGSAGVPLRHHLLLAVSRSESHEVTLSSQLTGMHFLSGASMTGCSTVSAPCMARCRKCIC